MMWGAEQGEDASLQNHRGSQGTAVFHDQGLCVMCRKFTVAYIDVYYGTKDEKGFTEPRQVTQVNTLSTLNVKTSQLVQWLL